MSHDVNTSPTYSARNFLNINSTVLCRILGSLTGGYEDYCLLECNAAQSVESQRAIRKTCDIQIQSKYKPNMKPVRS
jgi:hypothetical protein